jgi:hypothetical protein
MKLYKGLIILMAFMVSAISCKDFEPAIPYDTFDFAAYMRTISIPSGTYNFFDLENSVFTITVEAVDEKKGNLLDSYDLYVRFRDGGTNTLGPEVFLKTIPKSAFTVNSTSGLPRATFSVTAPEAAAATGTNLEDADAGDSYDIRAVMKLTDGRQYTNTNVNGDVSGGAFFRSPFFYRVNIVCPSNIGGTISYVATNSLGGGGGPGTGDPFPVCDGSGTVTFAPVSGSPGVYDISDASFGVFACFGYGSARGVRLIDVCGSISFSGPDQFGDTYDISLVSNDGTTLVLDWENTWGDGGRVSLTRTGGWPLTLFTN